MKPITKEKTTIIKEEASLGRYLAEIGREELLTAEEEVILARKIKEGDQEALEKLVKANLLFVVFVAKRYQNLGLRLSDLIDEGNLGLIKAAERYDETRGFKFISYAVWWVRQSILLALAEQGSIIRLPLNQINASRKINKAFSKLEQKYGREPSAEELALMLEFDPEMVIDVQSRPQRIVSLNNSIDGEYGEGTMLDVIEDLYAEKPDQALMDDSLKQEIEDKLSVLPEEEREIICLRYGINQSHPWTFEEIGEKFGLTRAEVFRIKDRAMQRLRYKNRHVRLLQNGDPRAAEVLSARYINNGSFYTKRIYYAGILALMMGDIEFAKRAIRQLFDSQYTFLADKLDTALKGKRFGQEAEKLFLENRPDVAREVAVIQGL